MILTGTSPEIRNKLGDELAKAAISTLSAFRGGAGRMDIAKLRALRLELALLCLAIPEESLQTAWVPLNELRTVIREMGLLDLPRTVGENEVLGGIRTSVESGCFGGSVTNAVVAGMLLAKAFELPVLTDFEHCPGWLLDSYLGFLFESPILFQRPGDLSNYGEFLDTLLGRMEASAEQDKISPVWSYVLTSFLRRNNLSQAYFLDRNVRQPFAMRGRLLERALELNGYPLGHVFRARMAVPDRIKLGILTQAIGPNTETFHNIAYFEHLDRNAFELNLYVFQETKHPLEEYCRNCCDRLIILPDDLKARVARIRVDDLDVVLIANNITACTNPAALVAAHRLARVQVASINSPATTGFRNMDVLLSSEQNEPLVGAQEQYTERLSQIEGSINCYAYQHDRDLPRANITRATLNCPPGATIYFSGANYNKIIPELFDTWARILAAVPESILVLMPFNPNWSSSGYRNQPFIERIDSQLAARGVGPGRLRIVGSVPTRADVQNVIRLCDIYLDSYPFAGACSLVDAVTIGLPIVAWQGATTRSRHAFAILRAMGLENLVATSEEEYIRKALEFGTQPALRKEVSAAIEIAMQNNPPVLDTKSFGDRIGRALHSEFERYVQHSRETLPVDEDAIARIISTAQRSRNTREYQAFSDGQITERLIQPYLRGMLGSQRGHIVDVGACHGQISRTFLQDGWTGDLFEPDGGAREVLNRQLAPFNGQYRLFPFAVSDQAQPNLPFYRATHHGLSGLGPTLHGQVQEVTSVRGVRLGEFLAEQGVSRIDFLKVDTEGWDFEVLAGHDFERLRPALVFIEFGSPRQRPSLARVLDEMHLRGYSALLFNYTDDGNFKKGIWQTRLLSVLPGSHASELPPEAFGNILFYSIDDRLFPLAVVDLFGSFRS